MNRKKKAFLKTGGEQENNQPTGRWDVQLFYEMFLSVNELPIDARGEINEICDWSTPTFYRKLGGRDQKGVSLAQLLSIADVYINNINRVYEKMKSVKVKLEKLRKS